MTCSTKGRRNLRNYLQTKGYFDAMVEVERQPVPDEDQVNIVYKINPGERHELEAIKIVGNKYFDEETIRERLTIQPRNWVLTNGRFSQRMMTDDASSIKALYQANGFQNVKVDASLDDNYEKHAGRTVRGVSHHRRSADPGEEPGDRRQQRLYNRTARAVTEQRSGPAVQRSRHHQRPGCDYLLLLQPRISRRAVRVVGQAGGRRTLSHGRDLQNCRGAARQR